MPYRYVTEPLTAEEADRLSNARDASKALKQSRARLMRQLAATKTLGRE